MAKKILLVVAKAEFQPTEYTETRAALERAGVQVVVASNQGGTASSSHDTVQVPVDLTLSQVQMKNFDGIFLIGGRGALLNLDQPATYHLLQQADQQGLLFGAICISPRILAAAEVLQGRRVTCWNDDQKFQEIADQSGAMFVHAAVVIDGNLITANGPAAAAEFGQAIVHALAS